MGCIARDNNYAKAACFKDNPEIHVSEALGIREALSWIMQVRYNLRPLGYPMVLVLSLNLLIISRFRLKKLAKLSQKNVEISTSQ